MWYNVGACEWVSKEKWSRSRTEDVIYSSTKNFDFDSYD